MDLQIHSVETTAVLCLSSIIINALFLSSLFVTNVAFLLYGMCHDTSLRPAAAFAIVTAVVDIRIMAFEHN